jgi:hypothetical protein
MYCFVVGSMQLAHGACGRLKAAVRLMSPSCTSVLCIQANIQVGCMLTPQHVHSSRPPTGTNSLHAC